MKQWFHKRNIIIVSERGVKHIPIAGGVQFAGLMVVGAFVCWASYSTGSFVAARHALKEQGQTLRTVASAHVASSFNPLNKNPTPAALVSEKVEIKTTEPMFTVSALKNDKMASRVAYLENKITQLESANAVIIQRVQEKTAGKIDDLEAIIKQTGLDAGNLKKQADKSRPKNEKSQGGPFIPADLNEISKSANDLFSDLDELAKLREIVTGLPLALPIRNAEPQSSFGHRYDPFTNRLAFHSGLDLAGPSGSKIYSTANGTVTAAERNGAYGNMIDIEHGNGVSTRYGHLSEILVQPGQHVRKGEVIGIQGSTGRSTGLHLHYEVRFHDQPMNPRNFLDVGRYVSQE